MRIARFCATGVLNTGIHIGVAWLLIDGLRWPPLAGNAVAFLAANIASYAVNSRWTFGLRGSPALYPKFLAASLTALAISSAAVSVAEYLSIDYIVAIGCASVLSALIGYVLSARLVFRAGTPERFPPTS